MLRRGVVILLVAAGLFGGSAAAGFLLAKGALRHSPGTAGAAPGGTGVGGGSATGILPAPDAGGGAVPAPAAPSSPGGPTGPESVTPGPAASPSVAAPAAPQPGPSVVQTVPAPAARPPEAPALPGRFHVQLAGFPERQNADALAVRLRAGGYAVTVTDGPPYRVWVGGYLDRATAERLAAYLTQAGFSPTLVPQ